MTCEIDDSFNEAEAQRLGDRATSYVVNDGSSVEKTVRYAESIVLKEKD